MPVAAQPAGAQRGAPARDQFECAHFRSTGRTAWCRPRATAPWLPPEYMYPVEQGTRSGLVGPWDAPDDAVCRREPGRHRAVGHHELPDLPEPGDPDLPRLVPAVPLLADLAQHTSSRRTRFSPAVRPCASASNTRWPLVVLKEYRCRTRARSAARRRRWSTTSSMIFRSTTRRSSCGICTGRRSTGSRSTRPSVARWGCERAEACLPVPSPSSEPFAEKWCLATEPERWSAPD